MRRFSEATDRRAIRMPAILVLIAVAAGVWFMHTMAMPAPDGSPGTLIGDSLLASAGKYDAGRILATYPPVPLSPLATLQAVSGLSGIDAAYMFSVCLAAILAGLWLRGMLRAGFRPMAALFMTLLLCLNPLFLRAVVEGPELLLVLAGSWLFAISAFAIRGRGGINDLMLCSASLMLVFFSGQSGILLTIATLPFLPLIMPADIRARSLFSVYLVLLFPLLFALLGFILINWMMLHDPLAFLRLQLDTPGEWFAASWDRAAMEIVLAVATAPILVGMFILARGRRPIQSVSIALLGTVLLLALLALQTGVGLSMTAALSPALGIAAAAAMRWPEQEHRAVRVLLLLLLGFLGGGSALMAQDHTYIAGGMVGEDRHNAPDRQLGAFLKGRSGVLIDAAAHPQVVAVRGSVDGLVTAGETGFELAMLRKRVGDDIMAVATAAPDPSRNADTIGRILPGLYAQGPEGFQLVYDRSGWRVWSRQPAGQPPRDGHPS